jgi:hypothetical protein
MTRHVIAAILVLALSMLACGQYTTPTPTPTAQPSPLSPSATPAPTVTPTPHEAHEEAETVTIRAIVYVRQMPDASSEAIGSLETGDVVEIVACGPEWCEIADGGFVWKGCTSDPAELKCEARP